MIELGEYWGDTTVTTLLAPLFRHLGGVSHSISGYWTFSLVGKDVTRAVAGTRVERSVLSYHDFIKLVQVIKRTDTEPSGAKILVNDLHVRGRHVIEVNLDGT